MVTPKTIAKVNPINGEVIKFYTTAAEAAEVEGYPKSHAKFIRDVCMGKLNTHQGFVWKFYSELIGNLTTSHVSPNDNDTFTYDPVPRSYIHMDHIPNLQVESYPGEIWVPPRKYAGSYCVSNFYRVKKLGGVITKDIFGNHRGSMEYLVYPSLSPGGQFFIALTNDIYDSVVDLKELINDLFYKGRK